MFLDGIIGSYQNFASSYPYLNSYFQGLGISFILYCIYLELNPKLGGIFIRPDHRGQNVFSLGGVIPMLKYPFQQLHFWKPENWDLNFIIFSQSGSLIYMIFKHMDKIRNLFGIKTKI